MNRENRCGVRVLALVAFLSLGCLVGCGGTEERAEHQEITGVDHPASEREANQHDVEPEKERESRAQN